MWQLAEDGNQPGPTECGHTKLSVAICGLNHTKTERATFFTYLCRTSRVCCELDDQGMRMFRLQVGEKDSALLRRVYICAGNRPVCFWEGTGSDRNIRLTINLPLEPMLRMHGAIPPLLSTLSWRCAQLHTRITLLHIPSQFTG